MHDTLTSAQSLLAIQDRKVRCRSILRRTVGKPWVPHLVWKFNQPFPPIQTQAMLWSLWKGAPSNISTCGGNRIAHAAQNATCNVRMRPIDQLETEVSLQHFLTANAEPSAIWALKLVGSIMLFGKYWNKRVKIKERLLPVSNMAFVRSNSDGRFHCITE